MGVGGGDSRPQGVSALHVFWVILQTVQKLLWCQIPFANAVDGCEQGEPEKNKQNVSFYYLIIIFVFYTLLSQRQFFSHRKFGVAFPKESQLQQLRYQTLINYKVHAGCFCASVIHQTLTWTIGSLTCVRDHSYACIYTWGLGTQTASQHSIFDSMEKLNTTWVSIQPSNITFIIIFFIIIVFFLLILVQNCQLLID